MTETVSKLVDILGEERFKDITKQELDDGECDQPKDGPLNAKAIHCRCKTLILNPSNAKLIVPTESMISKQKELNISQHSDKSFTSLVHGCYWLVDDMYKFEQIGYTKEIKIDQSKPKDNTDNTSSTSDQAQTSLQTSQQSEVSESFRYLTCAECSLCPLGWFDPKTKESYLYVW